MPEQFGTRTAYAEHSGTSKPYVTKLGHTGKLVEVERDGFDLLERASAGDPTAIATVLRDIDRWVEDGTEAPLQQYLRLPITAARRRRYRRDKWLRRAAVLIEASGPYVGACALKAELDTFLTRGAWFAWRDDIAPPEDATPLRTAIFFAVKFNDGEDLSLRKLQDIVGSVWR